MSDTESTNINVPEEIRKLRNRVLLLEKQVKNLQGRSAPFKKPTTQEVSDYANKLNWMGRPFNAQTFIDHYEATGWRIGKHPMKDWQAAVRTWRNRAVGEIKPAATKIPHNLI